MTHDNATVQQIISVGTKLLSLHGETKRAGTGAQEYGSIRSAEVGRFRLLMTTPFTRVKTGKGDYRYTLDIKDVSEDNRAGALFNAAWEPEESWAEPLSVFAFRKKRSGWVDEFVKLIEE